MTPDPSPANAPDDDHLLEDLARFTGLFTPENIWYQEETLDALDVPGEPAVPNEPAGS